MYVQTAPVETARRCRNKYALAAGNEEQPLTAWIPDEFYWQNSHGYGFDIRVLRQLLKRSFRNVNPHTVNPEWLVDGRVTEWNPEPIWCNAADLGSLRIRLDHEDLITSRISFINILSEETTILLADAARDLYSASYTGFLRWFTTLVGNVRLPDIGIATSASDIITHAVALHERRRSISARAILDVRVAQASEHNMEPLGVHVGTDMYMLLEMFKASVTRQVLNHLEKVFGKRIRAELKAQEDIDGYIDERMREVLTVAWGSTRQCRRSLQPVLLTIQLRYTRFAKHWRRKWDNTPDDMADSAADNEAAMDPTAAAGHHAGQEEDQTAGTDTVADRASDDFVARISVLGGPTSNTFIGTCTAADICERSVVLNMEDTVPWINERLVDCIGSARPDVDVDFAALSGGVIHWLNRTRGSRYGADINRFLRTMVMCRVLARGTPCCVTVVGRMLEREKAYLWPLNNSMYARMRGEVQGTCRVSDRFICQRIMDAVASHEAFEDMALRNFQLESGADGFTGSLGIKLTSSLEGRTCIQALAGELCHFLSVPFDPVDSKSYAHFQCDHSNVADPIPTRVLDAAYDAAAAASNVK